MPRAKNPTPGILTDTWGRQNRKLADRPCAHCGTPFHPYRVDSKYCSRPCAWANNGGRNRKPETWWTNPRGYIEGRVWIDGIQVRVRQHRWVMEQYLGRPLQRHEELHHRNGDKTDN